MLVVLCADIMHTQGASDYSFLSFLSFALRARKQLGTKIAVVIPEGLGGLDLSRLYTPESFAALAHHADLLWYSRRSCDHRNFDIRISDTLRVRKQFNLSGEPGPLYDIRRRPHPAAFSSLSF